MHDERLHESQRRPSNMYHFDRASFAVLAKVPITGLTSAASPHCATHLLLLQGTRSPASRNTPKITTGLRTRAVVRARAIPGLAIGWRNWGGRRRSMIKPSL